MELFLKKYFGFDSFRPGQKEVIAQILSGRSAMAVFPTGAGKSICYQLPALLLNGVTIVVSPLISLMKDQIDRLKTRGIPAERLDSSLEPFEKNRVQEKLSRGELKLLYVSPERFKNDSFRKLVRKLSIPLLAVDEAHCISEWGHNFRPDYLKIALSAGDLGVRTILAVTATATRQVTDDIGQILGISSDGVIRTGSYRRNLNLFTHRIDAPERDELLLSKLKEWRRSSIVYVTTQRTSERLAFAFKQEGLPTRPYHAGMKDTERNLVQDWFESSCDGIVVATIAFGMGIDKGDIRAIYHYNLPKSLENYTQEIGRAGRDGKEANCELFFHDEDYKNLELFAQGNSPDLESIEEFVERFTNEGVSDPEALAYALEMDPASIKILITYLELEGQISAEALFDKLKKREGLELERLRNVARFAKLKGCQTNFLANYFGEIRSVPCGHCSYCLSGRHCEPKERSNLMGLLRRFAPRND